MSGYGALAAFYDQLMSDCDYTALGKRYDGFIRQNGIIAEESPGILLDLACGTGTMSVLMAKYGWDVIAVDSSPEMLSHAKHHEKVSYICQDMTELDLYGTINAAICTLDGLNHLKDESQLRAALSRVALFMEQGGIFAFDVNTVYKHETTLANNIIVKEGEGVYCVWQNAFQGNGVVDITLDIFAEDESGTYQRFTEEFSEKAYNSETLKAICRECGFEILETQLDSNHEREYFVCKKV